MGRFARRQSYDEEPLPDLDSEAIDFRSVSALVVGESVGNAAACGFGGFFGVS